MPNCTRKHYITLLGNSKGVKQTQTFCKFVNKRNSLGSNLDSIMDIVNAPYQETYLTLVINKKRIIILFILPAPQKASYCYLASMEPDISNVLIEKLFLCLCYFSMNHRLW